MTYKKAKKEIDSRIEIANRHYRDVVPDYIEALEMASRTLGKQVPVKPYNDRFDGKCCPICFERATFQTWKHGYPVVIRMNYCQNCGQAIDWREE